MNQKFLKLINTSDRILITSHISPDPDAVSSALLAGLTLRKNFPGKDVAIVLEDQIETLSYLPGYDQIIFGNLLCEIKTFKPDLLLMLDGNNLGRFSKDDSEQIRDYLVKNKVKTAVIDHHEKNDADLANVFIHRGSPATAQDVYVVLFEELKLAPPKSYETLTLVGICADTGFFVYKNDLHRETFKIVSDLVDMGVSLEKIQRLLEHYSLEQAAVLSEIFGNVSNDQDYTYSFISDEFAQKWSSQAKTKASYKRAIEGFVNGFIKNFDDRIWGFVVYPDLAGDYSLSLRSEAGVVDVSEIARLLGGGGHKPAAGATIKAASIDEALRKVRSAIADVLK